MTSAAGRSPARARPSGGALPRLSPPHEPDLPPFDPATEGPGLAPGEPGDHELIRRAQGGEERAFALLLQRHEARAYRVARGLVGSREDALDLTQEAFLRVFRNLERFDFEHEFTTWLYRIVTNLAIDQLRKRRPVISTAGGEDEVERELPDEEVHRPRETLERAETASAVRSCIDSLAPHFRSVMILRELEGLPCTEIAEIVGATHVTVRWRLHRGRKLFQEEWERRQRGRGPEAGGGGGDALANIRRRPDVRPSD